MANETKWEKISNQLISDGYDVYPPDTYKGEIQDDYVVVKDNGLYDQLAIHNVSSSQHLFDILCYVKQYSKIESFVDGIVKSMDKLFPEIRPTNSRTTPYFDDTVKAYMVSIEYANYRKNIRR